MTTQPGAGVRRHRLRPPELGSLDLERPRLSEAIRATAPSGTCLISAPPGYGATTAAAHAVAGSIGVAWVGLDALDSADGALLTQLTAALAEVDGGYADAMRQGAPGAGGLAAMPHLIDALHAGPCDWIVIDGLDTITHATALPELAYLIANLPLATRLIVTTHDAPRRVPADLADRRLTVIDREQLLCTPDEAARIALTAAPGLDLNDAEEIGSVAGGWTAAIRAAARYAAQHPSGEVAHWLTARGAGELLGPWLDQLPDDRRRFLIDTVFLSHLSGPLCDRALDRTGSVEHLEALESHGSYLMPSMPPTASLDAQVRWWSRHPLLSAALAQRSDLVDQSSRNMAAAGWFMDHDCFEQAMRHLVAAGRLDEAGRYLSAHENALFERGRGESAATWYASLPPDSWGLLGWHLVRLGWGQAITREPHAAAVTLAQLRAHIADSPADGVEQRVLQAETATLASYVASMSGDTTTAIDSARRAIDLFCEESPDNSQQVAPATMIRALLWEGDVAGARREINRISFQPFPTGILREALMGGLTAQCLTDEGFIPQAQQSVRKALRWLASQRLSPIDVSQFSLMTADGASTLEAGDVEGSLTVLRAARSAAEDAGWIGDAAVALDWLARAHMASGQLTEALACLAEARRMLHETAPGSRILARLDLSEAFVRHIAGDAVRAERLVQRVPASDARTLMWARVTMHRQTTGARRALAALGPETPRVSVDKQVLLAMVAMKRSATLAEGHLLRAAETAGRHGLRQALLGCPPDLYELASSLASRLSHDALGELARARRASGGVPAADRATELPPESVAQPVLSAGDLELLTYLPRRDSNADIARQLGISVNTVKTRLYRMYRKLGVDSRDDAVRVARARGLVE